MRKFASIFAVFVVTAVLSMVSPGAASALGTESLGCRITPAPAGYPISPGQCGNVEHAQTYGVGFQISGETGTYSYAWSVPSQYVPNIYGGCTSTTDYCAFTTTRQNAEIAVSVVVTQNGSSETLSATAEIDSGQ